MYVQHWSIHILKMCIMKLKIISISETNSILIVNFLWNQNLPVTRKSKMSFDLKKKIVNKVPCNINSNHIILTAFNNKNISKNIAKKIFYPTYNLCYCLCGVYKWVVIVWWIGMNLYEVNYTKTYDYHK